MDRWGELGSASSRLGPMAGFCEHGDKPSCSVKKSGFFDKLSDNQLCK